mgnify:CR=1 FL=1
MRRFLLNAFVLSSPQRFAHRRRYRPTLESVESRTLLSVNVIVQNTSAYATDLYGVATDASGNPYFDYFDGFQGSILAKVTPNGLGLGTTVLSNGMDPFTAMVTVDSGNHLGLQSGDLLVMTSGGILQAYRPSTGALFSPFDLKSLNADRSSIIDIQYGIKSNFNGTIQTFNSSFGDFALYNSATYTDLFVSAVSGGLPYVIRVRFTDGQAPQAKVIASSLASDGDYVARGIAVNAQGTVLTTLPYSPSAYVNTKYLDLGARAIAPSWVICDKGDV